MFPTLVNKLIEGYEVDVLKTLSLVNSLVLPTPLGVPLTFNVSSYALVKVHGLVRLQNVPSWSDLVRRRSPTDKIRLDVNIQPRFVLFCVYVLCVLFLFVGIRTKFFSDRDLLGTKAHRSKIKKTPNRSGFYGQSLRLSINGRARDKSACHMASLAICRSRQEEAAFVDLCECARAHPLPNVFSTSNL